jgi:protein-disulfide isomerase
MQRMNSIVTQRFFCSLPNLILFAALLPAVVVPRAIAQSPNGTDAVRQQPQKMPVLPSLDGTPAIGDPNARIAIVEFGDYQCPFCAQHANQVLPQIVRDYVKTGKVRYFFKDTPVEAIHPQALKAAQAAHCAGEQGKYWEMHDRLFKNQQRLAATELAGHAAALDLDVPTFERCMENDTYAAQIRKGIQEGVKAGVRGTPTFFVGPLVPQDLGQNAVTILSGSQSYAAFQQLLDQLISSTGERKVP